MTRRAGNCAPVPGLAGDQPEILSAGNTLLLFPDLSPVTQSRCKGLAEIRKSFVCEVEATLVPEEPVGRENGTPLGQERPGSAGERPLGLL